MKKLFALLSLLFALPLFAQSPGVGYTSITPATSVGGSELIFAWQPGTGGIGVNVCVSGWCPITYTPALLKTYFSSVATALSVTGTGLSGAPIQLVNDVGSPGANMSYGTDGTGTKGWFAAGGGSSNFGTLNSGINTVANMQVGTGAQLSATGSGLINATQLNGNTFAAPGTIGGTTPGPINVTSVNGMTVPATSGALGYLGLPPTGGATKTASYTFAIADQGTMVNFNCSGTCVATIPANGVVAFPVGTVLGVHVLCSGTQTATISISVDTIYLSPSASTGSRTVAICGYAGIYKETATTWVAYGPGVT